MKSTNKFADQAKKTILVLEDEVALREAIVFKLKKSTKYNVVACADGREGMKHLQNGLEPHCVWLDMLMPNMDGFAFLQELRENEHWKEIPVMVVSVSTDPDRVHGAFKCNIIDYIVKSQFKLDEIVGRIKESL